MTRSDAPSDSSELTSPATERRGAWLPGTVPGELVMMIAAAVLGGGGGLYAASTALGIDLVRRC